MAKANPNYGVAKARFMHHGNMARAAREAEVNENSLRTYASRHGWREDRDQMVANKAASVDYVERSSARLLAEFYEKPTSRSAKMAREGIDLAEAVGAGRTVEESLGYQGDKDGYRELLFACLEGAKKQGRFKEVVEILDRIGELDGHRATEAGKGEGVGEVPMPDFAGIASLSDPNGPVSGGHE